MFSGAKTPPTDIFLSEVDRFDIIKNTYMMYQRRGNHLFQALLNLIGLMRTILRSTDWTFIFIHYTLQWVQNGKFYNSILALGAQEMEVFVLA